MSNTGSRAGSSDALSSLLTDLPGVEGNIFSRPKTLGGMKKVQQTPVKVPSSLNTSPKPPSDAPFPTSGRPPSYPSPTKQVYESTPSESHSIADLENMLQGSTPHNTATTNQINSERQAQPPAARTPSYDDPFADFVTSPPVAAQPTAVGHSAFTPSFSQLGLNEMNSVPLHDDPLDMFGGTPVPASTLPSQMNTTGTAANSNHDFFADFEEAPTTVSNAPLAGQQQKQSSMHTTPNTGGIDEFTEIGLSPLPSQPPLPPPPPHSTSSPLRTTSTSSSTSSFKDRISEQPPSTKASHKAFQFLDAKQAAGASTIQPSNINRLDSGAGNNGINFEDYQHQQGHSSGLSPQSSLGNNSNTVHPATESVVELGQRAAKALQAGTKWFMKASKQIATEVQSKIEKHRQHQHSSDHASSSGQMTTSHSFYFDWASQIARMSPGTRAAAMGAMQEEDRLEVQKIIDEAELGEIMLNSIEGDESGPLEQGQRDQFNRKSSNGDGESGFETEPEQQWGEQRKEMAPSPPPPPPPPPSYEELMGSTAAAAAAGKSSGDTTRSSNTPSSQTRPDAAVAPKVVDHHEEDLLGISDKKSKSASVAAPTATTKPEDDLLRMDGDSDNTTHTAVDTNSTGHIDDMFTVQKPGAATATAAAAAARRPSTSGGGSTTSVATAAANVGKGSTNAGGLSSMIDLGDSLPDVDTTGYSELYIEKESGTGVNGSGTGEDPNEPEIRKILRQKRIAEKHERMMRQLAEKRAREEAEDAEKAGKVAYRDILRPKIDAWASNKKDNIRALLSTVHTVLWEDSGWTAPSIADMVEPSKVKKWYMKANLVVHPDKVKQKGGTLEQVATADMVFDVLKGAWGKFDASK